MNGYQETKCLCRTKNSGDGRQACNPLIPQSRSKDSNPPTLQIQTVFRSDKGTCVASLPLITVTLPNKK